MKAYRVSHHDEEFTCLCGWPCDVGDKAIEHDGDVFCSKACANQGSD